MYPYTYNYDPENEIQANNNPQNEMKYGYPPSGNNPYMPYDQFMPPFSDVKPNQNTGKPPVGPGVRPPQYPGKPPYSHGESPGKPPYGPGEYPGKPPHDHGEYPGKPPYGTGEYPGKPPHDHGEYPGKPPYGPGEYSGKPPYGPGEYPGKPPHDHGGHGDNKGMPSGPPPKAVPKKAPGLYAVDPGAIYGCLYSYTYVWLNNGSSFWFYPTFVGRKSISGYRWSYFGWSYIGLDLDKIDYFSCSGY